MCPTASRSRRRCKRITHLGIGAHQDDLEFMAFHGILACFATRRPNGLAASPAPTAPAARAPAVYNIYRRADDGRPPARTKRGGDAGQYGVMIQLDYPSSAVKSPTDAALKNDLKQILAATRPEIVYTHNPADKHDTHIGVVDRGVAGDARVAARAATETRSSAAKSGAISTGCRTRTKC